MGEIRRRDRAPHTRGSPRDAPVSADGRRGQRRDALPSVTSSLARQAVADQIDAGATKTRQLAGICLSRAGGTLRPVLVDSAATFAYRHTLAPATKKTGTKKGRGL